MFTEDSEEYARYRCASDAHRILQTERDDLGGNVDHDDSDESSMQRHEAISRSEATLQLSADELAAARDAYLQMS
jgi:hypothetical protein